MAQGAKRPEFWSDDRSRRYPLSMAVYVATGTVVAASSGAALALIGSNALAIPAWTVALLCIALAVAGLREVTARRVWIPQLNRETQPRWGDSGAIGWALRNGASVGVGLTTRIGFYSYHALLVSVVLFGQVTYGTVSLGVYGASRTLMALPIGLAIRRRGIHHVGGWLLRMRPAATRVSGGLVLGAVGLVLMQAPQL